MYCLPTEHLRVGQELMGRSGANNFCLFLFHTNRRQGAVNFLCNEGMSEQVRRDYSAGLWAHDPFLLSINDNREFERPTLLERRQLEEKGDASRAYWRYIDSAGYGEIVASIHPFTADIFLIGGLMGQRRGANYCPVDGEQVMSALDDLVARSASDILNHSINRMFPIENQSLLPASSEHLTPKEKEVVLALSTGKSNKQIAAQLMLSEYTVQNHLKRLYRKFKVSNRTALLAHLQNQSLL